MLQQRAPASHHRRRGNTLLGAEDCAAQERRYRLPAKAESGDTRFPPFPATQAAVHREGKPHVVQPEAAGDGCPAEDYPKQPQPFGDRNGRTAARHHGKHECGVCFFLP